VHTGAKTCSQIHYIISDFTKDEYGYLCPMPSENSKEMFAKSNSKC